MPNVVMLSVVVPNKYNRPKKRLRGTLLENASTRWFASSINDKEKCFITKIPEGQFNKFYSVNLVSLFAS
jgi:hypothetical protein